MRGKVEVLEIPEIFHQTVLNTEQHLTVNAMLNRFKQAYDAIEKFYEQKLSRLINLKYQRSGKCYNLIWTCQKEEFDFDAMVNQQQVRDTKFAMYKQFVDKSPSKEALLIGGFTMYRSVIRFLGYSLPFFVTRVEDILEVVHAVITKNIYWANI